MQKKLLNIFRKIASLQTVLNGLNNLDFKEHPQVILLNAESIKQIVHSNMVMNIKAIMED